MAKTPNTSGCFTPGIYEMEGDDDDLGPFGMDANTRKRLKVSRLMQKKKVKPKRPMRTKLPYSLARVPKLSAGEETEDMSRLRDRKYLSESVGVKEMDRADDASGSLNAAVVKYYRGVLNSVASKLPSSFNKKGDSIHLNCDTYSGRMSGRAPYFEWSVSIHGVGSNGSYPPSKVEISAKVGVHSMDFIVGSRKSPEDFVQDVVDWMKAKQVGLVKKGGQ